MYLKTVTIESINTFLKNKFMILERLEIICTFANSEKRDKFNYKRKKAII
jgi:hypothetical protein